MKRRATDLEVARAIAHNESLREPEAAELTTDEIMALFDDEQPTAKHCRISGTSQCMFPRSCSC